MELDISNYPSITNAEIKNATANAIYWWNRDEAFYHKYFSRAESLMSNPKLLDFFARIPFSQFLRTYSVRRTIPAGEYAVKELLVNLSDLEFFKRVIEGDTRVIDEVSEELMSKKFVDRNTRSLLSKVAFLINPSVFSLYDGLAKESLYQVLRTFNGHSKSYFNEYQGFRSGVDVLLNHMKQQQLFESAYEVLNEFKGTDAHRFFTENREAFELRVVDKYLWLLHQDSMDEISSMEYINFHKI